MLCDKIGLRRLMEWCSDSNEYKDWCWFMLLYFCGKERNQFFAGVPGGQQKIRCNSVQQVEHKEKCSCRQNSEILGGKCLWKSQ